MLFTFRSVPDEFRLNVDGIVTSPHWDDDIVPFSLLIVAVVCSYVHIY